MKPSAGNRPERRATLGSPDGNAVRPLAELSQRVAAVWRHLRSIAAVAGQSLTWSANFSGAPTAWGGPTRV